MRCRSMKLVSILSLLLVSSVAAVDFGSYRSKGSPFAAAMLGMMEGLGVLERDRSSSFDPFAAMPWSSGFTPGMGFIPGMGMGTFPGMTPFPGMGSFPGMTPFPGMGSFPGMTTFPGMTQFPGASGMPGSSMFPQLPSANMLPKPPAKWNPAASNPYLEALQGNWETEHGALLIIKEGYARLYLTRDDHTDLQITANNRYIWIKPADSNIESQRYEYRRHFERLVMRDDSGKVLLARRWESQLDDKSDLSNQEGRGYSPR